MAKLKFIIILLFGLMLMVPDSYAQRRGRSFSQKAGPIWNGGHANRVCPQVCSRARAKWTGGWWTTRPGRMSVCQCNRNKKKFRRHRVSKIRKYKQRRFCRITKHRAWRAVDRCARYSKRSQRRFGRCLNRLKRIYGKNRKFMRHCKRQIRQVINHSRRLMTRMKKYRSPRRSWKRRYCRAKYWQSTRKLSKCFRIRGRRNMASVRKFHRCTSRVSRNQGRHLRRRGCYREANKLNRRISRINRYRSRWVRRYAYRGRRNFCRAQGNQGVRSLYRCLKRPSLKRCLTNTERRYKRKLKRRRCRFQVRRIANFSRAVKRISRRARMYTASRGVVKSVCRRHLNNARKSFRMCAKNKRPKRCMKAMEQSWRKKLQRNRCSRALGELSRALRKHRGKVVRKTASTKKRSSKVARSCAIRHGKLIALVNKCMAGKGSERCVQGLKKKHERQFKRAGCGPEFEKVGAYVHSRRKIVSKKRRPSSKGFCLKERTYAMGIVNKCASLKSSKERRVCIERAGRKSRIRKFKEKCKNEADAIDDRIDEKIK